jgi:hypothetical protein
MGASQRRKGGRFERAVAAAFRVVFPGAKRGLGQARAGGEVPDVDVPGFWPEAKAHRLTNPRAALAQAIAAAGSSGRVPIAVCKDDGMEPLVHLRLEDFVALLAERQALYGDLDELSESADWERRRAASIERSRDVASRAMTLLRKAL